MIQTFYDFTEADEAAQGNKDRALANLAYQVAQDETMGVIGMYEQAALNAGAMPTETNATIRNARRGT